MKKQVGVARQMLRKLLGQARYVFYPKGKGAMRWYEIGLTPTLEKFFGALPSLKKAVASPTGNVDTYLELPIAGDTRRAA